MTLNIRIYFQAQRTLLVIGCFFCIENTEENGKRRRKKKSFRIQTSYLFLVHIATESRFLYFIAHFAINL